MNAKERVIAALEHRPPDRIPTFDSYWEEFKQNCVRELGLPEGVDLADYFDIDIQIAIADETLLMDIAEDPEFARALADRVADHITEIGLESLQRGQLYDTGLWIYDDMGFNKQPMMSPIAFEKIFLPAYRCMVSAFKQAGAARVILHSDGNIGPLLEIIEVAQDGGVIIGAHSIGPDIPVSHYLRYHQTVKEDGLFTTEKKERQS